MFRLTKSTKNKTGYQGTNDEPNEPKRPYQVDGIYFYVHFSGHVGLNWSYTKKCKDIFLTNSYKTKEQIYVGNLPSTVTTKPCPKLLSHEDKT